MESSIFFLLEALIDGSWPKISHYFSKIHGLKVCLMTYENRKPSLLIWSENPITVGTGLRLYATWKTYPCSQLRE